jgi:hypothetical protein
MWGDGAHDPVEVCRPIGVEVYQLDHTVLKGWTTPSLPEYAGSHGLKAPAWGQD